MLEGLSNECDYRNSYLWKKSFSQTGNLKFDTNIQRLEASYDQLRDAVIPVLELINQDFSQLTLHDISHIDSLWRIGSIIVGDGYEINPLEGYILGCSFLIHDLALSYYAYGGKEALREMREWKELKVLSEISDEDLDFVVVRNLHAKHCVSILSEKFPLPESGNYLLQDEELRYYYAQIIGKIASSHHWDIGKVQSEFSQQLITPIAGLPSDWIVDPLKLACILRCADAAHLDNGRAPLRVFKELSTNSVSEAHWNGQNKLTQMNVNPNDEHQIIFSSTTDFRIEDFHAWNILYSAIRVCNDEIASCNSILDRKFKIKSVAGANSKEELGRYLKTSGWKPCDVSIRMKDIGGIIRDLSGTQLYGEKNQLLVVIRELIQNARDAVIARKALEQRLESRIDVFYDINNKTLVIEDNGVGMSLEVIREHLLGYHNSLWKSYTVMNEFNGLLTKGFKPIGTYGIGFFSVFMVAKQVTVTTRKIARSEIYTVRFPKGFTENPMICYGDFYSFSSQLSTRVEIELDDDFIFEKYPVFSATQMGDIYVSMKSIVSAICAGLDVDVYYNGELAHQNIYSDHLDKKAWLRSISFADDIRDVDIDRFIDQNYDMLDFIRDDNERILGLAALNNMPVRPPEYTCINTEGGLTATLGHRFEYEYFGLMEIESGSCSRNGFKKIKATQKMIDEWVGRQYEKLCKKNGALLPDFTVSAMEFNYDTKDVGSIFASHDNGTIIGPLSFSEIVERIGKGGIIYFPLIACGVADDSRTVHGVFDFREEMRYKEDIIKDGNINDAVISLEMIFYRRPEECKFRKFSFNIREGIPINDNSFLDCIYRKSKDLGINLDISFDRITRLKEPHDYIIIKRQVD